MNILSSKIEGVFVVMPSGRLDTNNYRDAEQLVQTHVAAGETKIIFDFSKTDYISSAGLRVILQAAKLVHKDGKIAICNTNEQVHEVLEISGFLDMIDHFSNLQQAMAAISG